MDENNSKQATLDDYYNYIQRWMAKFPIDQLPDKLLVEIFKQLPADDIPKLRKVCRKWYALATFAVDQLPKRRVYSLSLKGTSPGTVNSEVALFSKKDNALVWYFTDFSVIFNDVRSNGLIFCGCIEFGKDTPVLAHLPFLLKLKGHPQFRPRGIKFCGSNMKGVTEEQLIECAKSFAKDLKIMDFFHSKISNFAATNILLADLCSNLPDVSTDMYSFNFSPLTASTAVESAIRKWIGADPRTCMLHLNVSVVELELIMRLVNEPIHWSREGEGQILHPRSGHQRHFFYIWRTK